MKTVVSSTALMSRAAATVISLKIDPGSYWALMAVLVNVPGSPSSKRLPSKAGQLTIPRIAPVFGFITMTVPAPAR